MKFKETLTFFYWARFLLSFKVMNWIGLQLRVKL